jgi:hypothetical protein
LRGASYYCTYYYICIILFLWVIIQLFGFGFITRNYLSGT